MSVSYLLLPVLLTILFSTSPGYAQTKQASDVPSDKKSAGSQPAENKKPAPKPLPIAPAEKLKDGWETIDGRLVFLMVRLANVEAGLDAIEKNAAMKKGQRAARLGEAKRAERGNEIMDRKGGGPMKWSEFYGRTAETFFYHPVDQNTHYHTETILYQKSPQADERSGEGVPSRQGLPVHQRPPQFDYIYRANQNAKARAERDAEELAQKVDALNERRRKLEAEQVLLWGQIAFRAVSRHDLSKKPIYRFEPLPIDMEPRSRQCAEAMKAAALFVRTAVSIIEAGEKDQGTAFRSVKTAIVEAREKLDDAFLKQEVMAGSGADLKTPAGRFALLAKHLEDVSNNLSDSYEAAMDGDEAEDRVRKDTFRRLLQESLVNYAETVLALDEMSELMVSEWHTKPDVKSPLVFVGLELPDKKISRPSPRASAGRDEKGQDNAKKRNVRLAMKMTDENSIKHAFRLDGRWRLEENGLRLFSGASIETVPTLAGDFLMILNGATIIEGGPDHYRIDVSACGETFVGSASGNTVLRLERKGKRLAFQFGNQRPVIVILKDANLQSPSTIRVYCVPNGNYSGKSELFVSSVTLTGKADEQLLND